MPLVALDSKTGERIDVTVYENPRVELTASRVCCPECRLPMILKAGLIKIAHFAHKPGAECSYGKGETKQHLLGKRMIAEWLRETQPGSKVELELPIGNRRADIAQIFPNGWIVVHEIQLASITVESLTERTNDYLREGCDTVWYFGQNTATPTNRRWAYEHQAHVLILQFTEEQVENRIDLLSARNTVEIEDW